MIPLGGPFNSYESPPTFDNESPHSADSTDTVNQFPIDHISASNPSPSASPIPALIASTSITTLAPQTMPLYPSKSDAQAHHHITKTQVKNIKLHTILTQNCPQTMGERAPIFSDIACGGYVFDIAFYVKTQSGADADDNALMISIEHKKLKRGTKRKASHSQSGGTSSKKRRLNNSQSQSYSINNSLSSNGDDDDNDSNLTSENIELQFTINIASPSDPDPFCKTHKCSFGNKDDDSPNLCNWNSDEDSDEDSECGSNANLCSFRTETFIDLSTRYSKCTKAAKKKDQYLCFWFELQLQNVQRKDYRLRYDPTKIRYPRPRFDKRKITKFVGLKNEGATCYMNSMLQTLYHIAALRRNVYKIPVGHEAEQKKKAEKLKKEKERKDTADAMSVCEEEADGINGVLSDDEDDDDEDTDIKLKRNTKPPISLELQRLFYQLQTGAESNHQNEYELNRDTAELKLSDDDGNDSDCSIFKLNPDTAFANGMCSKNGEKQNKDEEDGDDDDDDVDMTQNTTTYSNRWQSSYDKAVSTSQLIKSFGWSGSDAFVQHDVQEFLRVLMDKIEAKVKGTPAESIVEKLFSGDYESYVKCKNVDYESVRRENFQDIQLTIPKNNKRENKRYAHWRSGRYDDSTLDMQRAPDIYDCIRKFIEPETLDGNNQYYANDELKKQDADKGLRFKRFPPVLFLQLCRFEIDHYQHTSKINDPVKFYEDIDLNPFIYVDKKKEDAKDKETEDDDNDDDDDDEDTLCDNNSGQNPFYPHLQCEENGCSEFAYQLFSVLVHSGSTYGGHYFAYLNPSGSQWYKFDDENVCEVDTKEATVGQYGGNSRQSAYMLVYIQKKYALQMLQEVQENDIPKGLRRYFSKERQRIKQQQLEQIENNKKCVLRYMNGHDLCRKNDELYVNVLDMGMRYLLQTKHVYKDTVVKELYENWSTETGIPMEHLMVWNYTERKNKTLRANREIKLDLNEVYKADPSEEYTQDEIKRHLIKTAPEKKHIKSIYDRIGDLLEKKRMFVLLDDRKMATLPATNDDAKTEENKTDNNKKIVVALKYFDFFTQKSYFADWIFVHTEKVTFGDIAKYIEDTLIANADKDNRVWMKELHRCYQGIDKLKSDDKTFKFYEEEAVLSNKGTRDDPVCKVTPYQYSDTVSDDFFYGDIFVFQMNPFHAYFNTLALPQNIDNIEQIVKEIKEQQEREQPQDAAAKQLPLSLKVREHQFITRGVYWYPECGPFIEGLLHLVNIEVKVRENTGWKQQWSKALLLQYKNNLNSPDIISITQIDKEIRKKIIKSKHKWQIERRVTFGMIRRKLGSYYNIDPHHIEIWLPQHSYSGEKWDYGSKGRGKWNTKLESILNRPEWEQLCPLKFEIQTYNVKDFDQMTKYDDYNSNSYRRSPNKINQFEERIKQLAMFNFEFIAPYRMKDSQMTISFVKDWIAKDVIQHVLKEVVQNPIFGYTFFANIIKYIKKYEMEETQSSVNHNDLLILQKLQPYRFLIIDDNENKLPTEYHMNKAYKMPDSYSQIKYTDFKVFFLAKNDPLVIQSEESKNKKEADGDKKNGMEIDNSDTSSAAAAPTTTKALWVFLRKQHAPNGKRAGLFRIVLEKGQTLKDVILKDCLPFLKTPKPSLSVEDDKDENNSKREDDALFDIIVETHKFIIKDSPRSNAMNSTPLKKPLMESDKIFDQLEDSMSLHIILPKNKSKYTSYHDRPLTILD